jgi:hypothetical protein
MPDRRDARGPMLLCIASFGWGAAVLAGGLWFPAVSVVTESCSTGPSRECVTRQRTQTLVDSSGLEVLYWLAVPSIVSVVVSFLVLVTLYYRSRLALILAWIIVGILWAISSVTGFSIGLWFMPSAVLLTIGLALTHSSARPIAGPPLRSS